MFMTGRPPAFDGGGMLQRISPISSPSAGFRITAASVSFVAMGRCPSVPLLYAAVSLGNRFIDIFDQEPDARRHMDHDRVAGPHVGFSAVPTHSGSPNAHFNISSKGA